MSSALKVQLRRHHLDLLCGASNKPEQQILSPIIRKGKSVHSFILVTELYFQGLKGLKGLQEVRESGIRSNRI